MLAPFIILQKQYAKPLALLWARVKRTNSDVKFTNNVRIIFEMIIFNCTKAAAEFFTVIHKKEKITCIESAPYKTIPESISNIAFGATQWHWVVHCVYIKKTKYLMVMDYQSRFCITFIAGKKRR